MAMFTVCKVLFGLRIEKVETCANYKSAKVWKIEIEELAEVNPTDERFS